MIDSSFYQALASSHKPGQYCQKGRLNPDLGLFTLECMWTFFSIAFASMLGVTPANQFVFNNLAEPETLDPHRLSAINDALLALQLYEGLVTRDETYEKVLPGLAAKWEISKDGLRYTFVLRKDLKWSNGEPLTSEQVRQSMLRAMAPEVACPFIQEYVETIEGAAAYVKNYNSPQRSESEAKVGILAKGDRVEFKLIKPNILFLDYLAQPHFFVLHPKMLLPDSKGWKVPEEFVGNGAYKLKEWAVNQKVVLEKNPFYREASIVKIPTLVALPISDQQTNYNLYKAKDIDWTGENMIPPVLVPGLRADPEFHLVGSIGTYTLVLNLKTKPLDDLRVRKALSLAIHRAEITDKILRGGQIPSNRMVPPGIPGYRPSIEPPAPFDRQIEMAKQLLAEAGFPEGKNFPKLTVVYNTNDSHHKIAQAIQQMWKKYLGIQVQIENKEWKVFLEEQKRKKYDISRQSWMGDLPDAGKMLDTYITDGGNNHTSWSNRDFDRLLAGAYAIRDAKKRNAVFARAEKILLNQQPIIPVYHYVLYSLMSPRIQGFKPNAYGHYFFKYLIKK